MQDFLDLPRPSTGTPRPSVRPGSSRPGVGTAIGAGAAGGAAAAFLNNRGIGQGPSQLPAGARPGAGDRPVAGQRPAAGQRPGAGERPGAAQRPADRLQGNRPDRIDNRQQLQNNRQQRRQEIRGQMRSSHYDRRGWYGQDFWRRHPHAHWRFRPGFNCWRPATWGLVTGWLASAWSQPAYYNYGENVYYQGDAVYYGDQEQCSAEEYAAQAEQIATSVPEVSPDDVEWMPLGVFALTQDGQSSGTEPTLFVQLAVSKEGIIAGTIQNTATDSVLSIEGMIDKQSQRAAWTVVDKTRPLVETGVYNLTQETTPALIHFADGQTQQWLMVRLDESSSSE